MATSVGIMAVKQPADNGCQHNAAVQGAQKEAHGMVLIEELVRLLLVQFESMAAAGCTFSARVHIMDRWCQGCSMWEATHSMEAVKELLLLLVVQGVGVAHVGQRLLGFQRREDDLVLRLHAVARSERSLLTPGG